MPISVQFTNRNLSPHSYAFPFLVTRGLTQCTTVSIILLVHLTYTYVGFLYLPGSSLECSSQRIGKSYDGCDGAVIAVINTD